MLGASGAAAGSVNQAMANSLDTSIKSAFSSSGLAALCPASTILQSVGIRSLVSANLPEFVGTGASVPGTGTGDPMPRAAAVVATLRTALAGRSYRGRVFFTGLNEGQNDSVSTISAAAQTAVVAFVNAIGTALTAQGLSLAVLSPALPERPNSAGGLLPAKAAFATPVTSVTSRSAAWGSQRRRTHRT